MQQITWTEFKKLTLEEAKSQIPFEITYNGDAMVRVVPVTWRDPRFIATLAERDLMEKPLQ